MQSSLLTCINKYINWNYKLQNAQQKYLCTLNMFLQVNFINNIPDKYIHCFLEVLDCTIFLF